MSVSRYYSRLKTLWDELENYLETPMCSCSAFRVYTAQKEREKTHQFLMGLGSEFSTVRSNVLSHEPAHSLNKNRRKEIGDVGRQQFDLRRTGRRQRSNDHGQDLLPLQSSGPYQERLLVAAWLSDELGTEGSGRRRKIRVFDSREEDRRSGRRNGRAAAWGRSGPESVRWAVGPSGAETRSRSGPKSALWTAGPSGSIRAFIPGPESIRWAVGPPVSNWSAQQQRFEQAFSSFRFGLPEIT
ncbi:hypothetical protein CRG98_013714 [Punica granatum]|uniref:Retrotransposon gag domain-containing protein n=1 Tax=Punica granatum TaxID=22663 RepID=A0A2I0KBI9_PUNGR|nr:hypothetical protein CRG98_013714 [Punica granatum]